MTQAGHPDHQHAAPPPWRDVRVLRVALQLVVLLAVGIGVAFLLNNLVTAMGERGLTFGYSFLDRRAGFEIGESPIPYDADESYGQAFLVGLLNTLFVSLCGIVLATVLGVLIGVARLSPNWLVSKVAAGYVEMIRNTPLLVQLFLIYFAVLLAAAGGPRIDRTSRLRSSSTSAGLFVPGPQMGAILRDVARVAGRSAWSSPSPAGDRRSPARPRGGRSTGSDWWGWLLFMGLAIGGWVVVADPPLTFDIPERGRFNFSGGLALSTSFTALLTGLVIYTAAFIAEVVRGGIQAVRRGQLEAARALGLSEVDTLRLVIFPQALRVIVPPLTSQYLNLVKNSSLAIAVGYPDLFKVGTTMANQTGQPVPVIAL